jgi:Lrp/AsnC family transcriptional regulator, leucine-responsive regulatory protein
MPKPGSKTNGVRRSSSGSQVVDDIDRKLLSVLLEDAKQKYAELGARIHLSPAAVFERVKRLERDGILRRFTISLDPVAVGLPVCAFIRVKTRLSCRSVAQTLVTMHEIEECHAVAGEDCLLLKVRVETPQALEELLDRMKSIEGLESTITTVVLTTHFERPAGFPAARSAERASGTSNGYGGAM